MPEIIANSEKDIESIEDIQLLVDSFYSKVREDELLADIFNSVVEDNWPKHLDKMYRFWQTVLLDEHTYFGSPFIPHAKLPIEAKHFKRWLQLFSQTISTNFKGKKANEALWRAERMAEMFLSKINYYQNNSTTPL